MRSISRIFVGMLFAAALAFGQSKAGPFTINASTSPCATIQVTANATVGIYVAGTFSATLQPEVALTGRDGSTGTPQNTQVTPSTSTTAASTITAAGIYTAKVAGADTFLLCVTSFVSGTATVYLNATTAVSILIPPAAAAPVTSVFTRTGAVVAASGDYTVAQVTGAAPLASPTFTGTVTLPASLTMANQTTINPVAGCCGNFAQQTVATGNVLQFHDRTTFNGDTITMGPWVSAGDTNGIILRATPGAFVQIDCNDAACPIQQSGVIVNAETGGAVILELNSSPQITINSTGQLLTNLSKPTKIASQTTAGTFGMPVVVGSSTLTGRTTALGTTTVYTAGAAVETLSVQAIVNCDTSVSTATATLTIVYTDSSNTAITTTGSGALCTTLGTAAQQSINLPLIRAKNATVVSWAIAIANSPNFDASIQIERYQ